MPQSSHKLAVALASIASAIGVQAFAQPATTMPATSQPTTQRAPYAEDIEKFEAADAKQMPAAHGLLFVGSSTIRFWDTDKWFPNLNIINRGFGGSQMSDAVRYEDRIVTNYQPKLVVLYEGDNDLSAGVKVERVVEEYQTFIADLHAKCPDAKLIILSAKPSGSREQFRPQIDALDAAFAKIAGEHADWISYFDGVPLVTDANGKPRDELFRPDRLHMNEKGYELWSKALAPRLDALMKE